MRKGLEAPAGRGARGPPTRPARSCAPCRGGADRPSERVPESGPDRALCAPQPSGGGLGGAGRTKPYCGLEMAATEWLLFLRYLCGGQTDCRPGPRGRWRGEQAQPAGSRTSAVLGSRTSARGHCCAQGRPGRCRWCRPRKGPGRNHSAFPPLLTALDASKLLPAGEHGQRTGLPRI